MKYYFKLILAISLSVLSGCTTKEEPAIKNGGETERLGESLYANINWDENTISSYDKTSGLITIAHNDSEVSIEKDKAIVLPDEYGYDIRVIKNITVSGDNTVLETEQGKMSHLFRDIDFTLATDPSSARSTRSSGNVILPSEIGIMTTDGYHILFGNEDLRTRDVGHESAIDIFSLKKNYSGESLYSGGSNRLFWEKALFDIGLKGVFHFNFGKTTLLGLPVGDLKQFDFYLDGNLNVDLLLKYAYSSSTNRTGEKLLKENILPVGVFKFMVPAGGVPVPVVILVYTHLKGRYDFAAAAEVTMSTGININANARMGMEYSAGSGVRTIQSFTPGYSLYEPTFTAEGSANVKASIFPRIDFGIYGFIGPRIEPMPYVRGNLEAGMRASTDGSNYLAWNLKAYAGIDVRMGLDLDFGLWDTQLLESNILNASNKMVYDAPKKIELLSPNDGIKIPAGKAVEVRFQVSHLIDLLSPRYYPCPLAFVNFSSTSEDIQTASLADKNGVATVVWTPRNEGDVLTAKVMDKDGNTISEATFSPEIENSILGFWDLTVNSEGSGISYAFVEVKENGIAVLDDYLNGTWSMSENGSVRMRWAEEDNISWTLNGMYDPQNDIISGSMVDVWAWYDEDGVFLYNETYGGTFSMIRLDYGNANYKSQYSDINHSPNPNDNTKSILHIIQRKRIEKYSKSRPYDEIPYLYTHKKDI